MLQLCIFIAFNDSSILQLTHKGNGLIDRNDISDAIFARNQGDLVRVSSLL